ncbi:hypothetical protein SDC9_78846 [bioreactor metagenome]|uniref:Uncharacterized protein n=1 Tax=bioreactor metagenome TaxID=1076179 RepID=A0A644Z288_9ZZZZ
MPFVVFYQPNSEPTNTPQQRPEKRLAPPRTPPGSPGNAATIPGSGALGDDLIDQAVILGLGRGHEVVALGVGLDLLVGLTGALGQDAVHLFLGAQNVARMDFDVRRLTTGATQHLVDHDLGVGQRKTLALGTSGQQEGTHAGGKAAAQRGHVRLDELHGVVDGHAGRHAAAGRVNVERDVLVGILALQEQQLRHDEVGGLVVDLTHQEDHALFQQARVDVVGPLAAARLFDDHGDHAQGLCFQCTHVVLQRDGYLRYLYQLS